MSEFGGLDFIIIAIVVYGMWRGFQAGFIKSVVSLVGWFVALVMGTRFASSFAPNMAAFVSSEVLQLALAFLAIVLVVICVIHIFAKVFNSILNTLRLGMLDKLAGGILGSAKNLLIVLVIMSASAPLLVNSTLWQSSKIAPELMPYAPMAKTLTQQVFGQAWQQINQ